jgi:hypothetical protein
LLVHLDTGVVVALLRDVGMAAAAHRLGVPVAAA